MTKFQKRFNAKMKEWYDSDKSITNLFTTEYQRMLAYLWAFSEARKSEENISEIKEFGSANRKAIGDSNYDNLLRTRDYCCRCGETYRLENLSICVECDNLFCYRCNRRICGCSGEVVG
ncbi:MAG: hypothetical protein HC836_39840 [Richelia sp. RM2_1_2]|nr:hypothetical protein [Richelia sp. SM1_7_0]NJN13017.1 hypothetical protein [Richelia sp. RM1_1_1]NJO31244.1 hypothetical protein [Richelia sp. SL_2_1]NJO64114.1 hypothetical protein [Richelia sp. RM2_1_2]